MKVSHRLFASQNPWRESATLLLVAPTRVKSQPTLSYLTMTRSMKSKFMPGGQVFPGGATSPIDSSPAWTELYAQAGMNLQTMTFSSENAHRPTIYDEDKEKRASKNLLPQEIALRIAAIRETFEECGILLGKSTDKSEVRVGNPNQLQDEGEILRWQSQVKKNPDEFLTLCRTFSVVPDIKSLCEWSNWLTPTTFRKIRFDTLFFMTTVPQPLPVVIDNFEADAAEWSSADELLDKHKENKNLLMPPQLYELSRLRNIHTIEDMNKLMDLRRQLGIERWLPQIITTEDGFISVFPGDDLYPSNPNLFEHEEIGLRDQAPKKLHRILHNSVTRKVNVMINAPPRYGHYYHPPQSSKI